jgi:hypothetical protein
MIALMRWSAAHVFAPLTAIAIVLITGARAAAQDPPPPIPRFVVDLRGSVPRFPSDDFQLASSRGLEVNELPGVGLGVDAGVHVFLMKWKAITFGLGGQLTLGRAHSSAVTVANQPVQRAVTERYTSMVPQLSFNFGTGDGWSYVSGGIGGSTWSIVPDGEPKQAADEERLRTINYGGGARWFIKRHLAFTLDVRFHAIDPGSPNGPLPGSPRTRLLIIGAGLSVK